MARGLFIPSRLDLDGARRDMRTIKKEGREAGTETAAEFLKGQKAEMFRRQGEIKEAQRRDLISKEEARRLGNDAAREFNRGVLARLDELRRAGKENTEEFVKLQRSLRAVGTSGRRAGDEATTGIQKLGRAIFSVKGLVVGLVTALAARAFFRFLGASVRQAEEAAGIWAVLGANVDNAGVSFERVRPQIEAVAEGFQRTTRFGDEDFAEGLSELISITGDYTTALAFMGRVLDLSSAKHIDVKTAAQLYGRVLVGDTALLKRYGIVVQEGANALEVMQERFQGAAEKEGRSLSGRLQRLRNEFGDLREAVGEAVIGSDDMLDTTGDLADQMARLRKFIEENKLAINGLVVSLGGGIVKLGEFAVKIANFLDPSAAQAGTRIAQVRGAQGFGADLDVTRLLVEQERQILRELEAESARLEADRRRLTERGAGTKNVDERLETVTELLEAQRATVHALETDLELAEAAAEATGASLTGTGEDAEDAAQKIEAAAKRVEDATATFREAGRLGLARGGGEVPDTLAAKLAEIVRLEKEIGQLEGDIALLGGRAAEPEAAAFLDSLVAQLDRVRGAAARSSNLLRDMPAAVAELATAASVGVREFGALAEAGLEPVSAGLVTLRGATEDLATAEALLKAARIAGDAVDVAVAEERLERARGRVTRQTRDLAAALREAGLSDDRVRTVVEAIESALKAAGVEMDGVSDSAGDFASTIRTIETSARGLLSVADYFGEIDQSTRRALTGILDVLGGLEQVKAATALEGFAGIAGIAGGVGAVAGGLVGVLGGLLGGDRRAERLRELNENTRAIRDLVERIDGLANEIGPLESAVRSATDAANEIIRSTALPLLAGKTGGLEAPTNIPEAREQLIRARDVVERQAARAGSAAERGAFRRQLEEIDAALAALDEFFARLRAEAEADLSARKLIAEGRFADAEIAGIVARQEAELADFRKAGLDDLIPLLEEVQALELDAARRRLESAERDRDVELEVRRLRAEGLDAEAFALERQRAREKELEEARTDAERATIRAIQAEEDLAAGRDAAAELALLEAESAGNDLLAEEIRLREQANAEIERARGLLEAGLIDQATFERFVAAIEGRLTNALEAAAEAAEEAARAIDEDLTVRLLRAQGLDREANLAEFEARQRVERQQFEGTADQFDKLLEVQAAERSKFLRELGGAATADRDAGRLERGADTVAASLQGATTAQFATVADILRSSLTVERASLEELKRIARGTGGYVPPSSVLSPASAPLAASRTTIQFGDVNVTLPAGIAAGTNPQIAGRIAGRSALEEINRGLGGLRASDLGNAGSLER